MPTKSKIRSHGAAPANWQYRDGRPRWIPSPRLRAAGWKGFDLRDNKGAYLGKGASIDAAERINAAVAAWRAGEAIAPEFHALAPGQSAQLPRPAAATSRSIGPLIDAYTASNEFLALKPKTQAEYRSKLKRLVDTLAGYPILPPDAKDPAYLAAVAGARAWVIDVLDTPKVGEDRDGVLYTVYWGLRGKISLHMANGVMATASAWLDWCKERRRVIHSNPAHDVNRTRAEGRMQPASWEVLAAMVKAAEEAGYPSIADSFILGADLSWSQGDRLALTWGQIVDDRVRARRIKTNRPGEVRLLKALGQARLPKIRARQNKALGGTNLYTHIIVCETTAAPWKSDHYRHTVAEIRKRAALTCPAAAGFMDKDLRCTAVCVAYDAGLNTVQIAGRTLHSLDQVTTMLDDHYGKIRRDVGDAASSMLDAYLAEKGVAL